MHHSRLLRRLLRKGRCQFWRRNQKAAILQLPLDILVLITDNLALHDKFLLSHTCKALRQVLLQEWDIELPQLSFEHQIGFWVGLAYTLPSRWVCLKCCKLHPIDTSDVPAAFMLIKYGAVRTVPCSLESSRGIEVEQYSVQHYHIQLALKLSRLGNVYQQYLAALMQTFTHTRTKYSLTPPLTEFYAAEPRIINRRFILREEWKISNNTNTALPLFPDQLGCSIPVCPHMRITMGGLVGSRNWKESSINVIVHWCNIMSPHEGSILLKEVTLLEDSIELAYESPGQWIFNSCLHCSTDLAVMISTDERKATIRAWHDFGIEGSPLDASWKAHVRDENRANWLYVGPYVDYTHGSIRELWSEHVSHGTGTSHAKLRSIFTKLIDGWSEV
ncbi:hypothetical protein TGAM01_v205500 [Trichoderma gamsii]|uniref:F-box domain-containing protein n=1 Tax=Trichoderma gamsii TaxID=398673 RepID=A0A2P4ZMU4_9HYPO|nr:hypothetical protein TGAM01_v205500 [Trichoderma gamsii]PON25615.1 hypothetical protein TGAM01_v205500 [Trichoderma gamsii]